MSPESGARAVLYLRVSTVSQSESGHGLDAQRTRLEEYAQTNGLQVVEVVVDGGVSGASLERPGFARVRQMVASGEVDVVVATKGDRIARSLRDMLNLVDELNSHGASICLTDEDFDTASPASELTMQIRGAVAQYERSLIAQRTREGLQAAKAKGVRLGKPPVGFTVAMGNLVPLTDDPRYRLGLRALNMMDEGVTMVTIAEIFNEEGLRASQGGRWWPSQVKNLVRGHLEYREAQAVS